jgi:hypothetical protein
MKRLSSSAYPEHPWRQSKFVAPKEDEQDSISRATIHDLAYQQDIPALQQHLQQEQT